MNPETPPKSRVSRLLIPGGRLVAVALVALVLFAGFTGPLVYVPQGSLAVVVSPYVPAGYRAEPLAPGVHFLLPGESLRAYPTSAQSVSFALGSPNPGGPAPAEARDGSRVALTGSLIYSLNPHEIARLHVE